MVRKTFADPLNRPQKYWVLVMTEPPCVNVDPNDSILNDSQKEVRSIQLVLQPSMYSEYKNLLGKEVVARGTLFSAITGHHHTPVLLTVSSIKITGTAKCKRRLEAGATMR